MKIKLSEREVIKAMAHNSLNVSEAAKDMYCHRNTVDYRCSRLYAKTGYNPKTFFGLLHLLSLVHKLDESEIKKENNQSSKKTFEG